MYVVETKNVCKEFKLGNTIIAALNGVDVSVSKGEFIAIAGPSGSGKTTLLNLIGCIDLPTSGSICIDSIDINRFSSNKLAELRSSKIGFVFQTFNLIPVLSAFENVEYPLYKHHLGKKERQDTVLEALTSVGIERFARHRPDELSGGQRQRVAIARALVSAPKIVLADEPTANLDQKTGATILDIMKKINEDQGTVFIFSTHDPNIMKMASRVIRIMDGKIVSTDE